jgi:hypothetical protein
MKKVWMKDPHSGGKKIPEAIKTIVRNRILTHAEKNYAGKYRSIDIRFKGAFVYIDAYTEPDIDLQRSFVPGGETREQYLERLRNFPTHLCRLRYFELERWSVAFFTYSHEKYEPSILPSGKWIGTPEEGFDIGGVYLE